MLKKINRATLYRALTVAGVVAAASFYSFRKEPKLGLDLKGGVSILLEAHDTTGAKITEKSMEKLAETIERRINVIGVSEPVIQIVGNNKALVEIPGVEDAQEAIAMIGKTALLEFKLMDRNGDLGPTLLTGKELKKADVSYNSGSPVVNIKFLSEGAKTFYDITRKNVGKRLAITLDGEVQSSPNIKGAIPGGEAFIEGDFNFKDANKLALMLSAGSLPLKVSVAEVRTVSATLGEQAITSSLKAGMWAMVFVVAFMVFWYFLPGLIASIALAIFGLITLGAINFLGATLTLPGIAGFILSLGMAVDANVIIFEMIKEELEKGNSVSVAIKSGFNKAYTSILDSNITTLIVTFILFVLGTGAVKGYAVTLSLGIFASMFTAIFVTRLFLTFTVNFFNITNPKAFGLVKSNFNFKTMKFMKPILGLSLAAMIFGGWALATKGFNYGVDFTGGNFFTFRFAQEIDSGTFNKAIDSFKGADLKAQVQFSSTSDNGVKNLALVRTAEIDNDTKEDLYSHLRRSYGQFSIQKEDSIGASVGNALKQNAIWALVIGALAIMLYISIRFQFKYALAAIAALMHDVLIAVGAIAYLGLEINSPFIIAILTILGYSINDTVVVFDRIRENHRHNKDFKTVINNSINQVFVRSLNTSLTTFLSLLALLMYGSASIQTFLTTFLFGIIAGTYSSIFVASPLVYLFDKVRNKD